MRPVIVLGLPAIAALFGCDPADPASGCSLAAPTDVLAVPGPMGPTGPAPSPPPPPTLQVGWTDNSGGETGFVIESSSDGGSYGPVATVGPDVTSYTYTPLCGPDLAVCWPDFVRIRATGVECDSDWASGPVAPLPPPPPTL